MLSVDLCTYGKCCLVKFCVCIIRFQTYILFMSYAKGDDLDLFYTGMIGINTYIIVITTISMRVKLI